MRRLAVALVGLALVLTASGPAVQAGRDGPRHRSWAGLNVPYVKLPPGNLDQHEDKHKIRFRGTQMPYVLVGALAATHDSALALEYHPEADAGHPLHELRAVDGRHSVLDGKVMGIPMADPAGHVAFWTSLRRHGVGLVAYDTKRRVRSHGPLLGPDYRVYAVDGDTAYYASTSGRDSLVWSWKAGQQPVLVPPPPATSEDSEWLIGDVEGDRMLWTDLGQKPVRTVVTDRTGNVLMEVPGFLGSFSPDGQYRAVAKKDVEVWDLTRSQPVTLHGLGSWRPYAYQWTPDGRVVVSTRPREGYEETIPARKYVCSIPNGKCVRLRGLSRVYLEPQFEPSSYGQYVLVTPYI